MDYSNEEYVKVYRRETDDDLMLSWQALALWRAMLMRFDRSGLLETRRGPRGLAAMVRIPDDVVAPAISELIEDGRVQAVSTGYFAPRFLESQEARKSDKQRQRESRVRRAQDASANVVSGPPTDEPSCNAADNHVTRGHTASHAVTNVTLSSADPKRSEAKLSEPQASAPARVAEVAPKHEPTDGMREKRTQFRKTIRAELEAGRQRAAKATGKRYIPLLAFDRGLDADLQAHVARTQTIADLEQLQIQALHAIEMCEMCVVSGQEEYRWFTGCVFSGGNFARYAAMSDEEARRGPKPKTAADVRAEEARQAERDAAAHHERINRLTREADERKAREAEEERTDPSKRRMTPAQWLATEGLSIWGDIGKGAEDEN